MDILAWMKAYTTLVKQKISGIDLSGYAKKTDIPAPVDTSGLATKTELQAVKDSIPADVDLSAYAKKTDIPAQVDVSGLATKTELQTLSSSVSGSKVVACSFRASSGYIKFSSGLIMQWGVAPDADDEGDYGWTSFPVCFTKMPVVVPHVISSYLKTDKVKVAGSWFAIGC